MHRRGAIAAIGTSFVVASLILLALASCHHEAGLEAEPMTPPDRLSQAIAEAAVQPAPPGTAQELWDELTAELVRQLANRRQGRLKVMNTLEPPLNFHQDGQDLLWTARLTGDYDNNGEVNIADLAPVALYYQSGVTVTQQQRSPVERIDGDNNGEINIGDVTPIALHYGETLTGYAVLYSDTLGSVHPAQKALLNRPASAGGTAAPTPIMSYTATDTGYYSVSPRGAGQSDQVRSEQAYVEVSGPGPNPGPDPDPDPEPLPDPDPDPEPDPDAPRSNVVISVVDKFERPISYAAVILSGHDPLLTNEYGWVLFREVQPADRVVFTVRCSGYADSTKVIQLIEQQEAFVRIKMAQQKSSFVMDPVEGGMFVGLDHEAVSFPPGALVDSYGQPVTDPVNVSITPINVADPNMVQTMPGDFTARQADGSIVLLQSYGVMDIFVDDGLGNRLGLAPDKTIELSIPVAVGVGQAAPAEMGFYGFDSESGLWIEEGKAQFDAEAKVYIAQVNSMPPGWNCDRPWPTQDFGCLQVSVVDHWGDPMRGLIVKASATKTIFVSEDTTNSAGVAWFLTERNSWVTVTTVPEDGQDAVGLSVFMPGDIYQPGGSATAAATITLPLENHTATTPSYSLTWPGGRDLDLHVLLPGMIGYREWCNRLHPEREIVSMRTDSADGGLERIVTDELQQGIYDVFAYQYDGPENSGIEESQAQFTLWTKQTGAVNVTPTPDNPEGYRNWHIGQLKVSQTGEIEFVEINAYTELSPGMY